MYSIWEDRGMEMHNTGNMKKKIMAMLLCIMVMLCNTALTYAGTDDLTGDGQIVADAQERPQELASDGELLENAGLNSPAKENLYDTSVSVDVEEDESMAETEGAVEDSETDTQDVPVLSSDTGAEDAFTVKIEEAEIPEQERTESDIADADESLTEEVHQEAIQEDIVPEELLEYEEMVGAATRSPISFPVTYKGRLCYDDAAKAIQILNKERKAVGVDAVQYDETYQKTAMERAKQASIVFDHAVPNGVSRDLLFGMVPTCKEIMVMGTQNESVESLCNNLFGENPAEHAIEIGRQGAHREDALNRVYYAAGAGFYRAETVSVLVIHLGREHLSRQPQVTEKSVEQISASYFGISMSNTNGYSPPLIHIQKVTHIRYTDGFGLRSICRKLHMRSLRRSTPCR